MLKQNSFKNSITKLVSYIIIVISFAFVCLYSLDNFIIETNWVVQISLIQILTII